MDLFNKDKIIELNNQLEKVRNYAKELEIKNQELIKQNQKLENESLIVKQERLEDKIIIEKETKGITDLKQEIIENTKKEIKIYHLLNKNINSLISELNNDEYKNDANLEFYVKDKKITYCPISQEAFKNQELKKVLKKTIEDSKLTGILAVKFKKTENETYELTNIIPKGVYKTTFYCNESEREHLVDCEFKIGDKGININENPLKTINNILTSIIMDLTKDITNYLQNKKQLQTSSNDIKRITNELKQTYTEIEKIQ